MIIHDLDKPLRVPRDIAKCPYCDRTLVITYIEEFTPDPDGGKIVEFFADGLDCISKPECDSPRLERWLESHNGPAWRDRQWNLNVEYVLEWAQENVRFVSSTEEQRKLEKWVKAAGQ